MREQIKGERPRPTAGLRHVALFVEQYDASLWFYTELMDMQVEWQPDADNTYLSSGTDNLALHKVAAPSTMQGQRLDHIGFVVDLPDDVDQWYAFLSENNVPMKSQPRTHRDGARSFYCNDPDGTLVQIIFHPPISKGA
jgi:catechol 2,3-dioxygenase-like lactoylglutathione lyase family enzyme